MVKPAGAIGLLSLTFLDETTGCCPEGKSALSRGVSASLPCLIGGDLKPDAWKFAFWSLLKDVATAECRVEETGCQQQRDEDDECGVRNTERDVLEQWRMVPAGLTSNE